MAILSYMTTSERIGSHNLSELNGLIDDSKISLLIVLNFLIDPSKRLAIASVSSEVF